MEKLSKNAIVSYRSIYQKKYGVLLPFEVARTQAENLLTFLFLKAKLNVNEYVREPKNTQ